MGNRLHTGAIQVVADQMAMDLLGANGALGDHARRVLRQARAAKLEESTINEVIGRGLVQGETLLQTSRNLRREIQKNLEGGAKVEVHCKDGKTRLYDPDYYAEMVAQTRTREATTQANINGAVEFGVTLFQVSFHEGACDYCVPFQGKVYSLDGKEGGFPKLEEKPPYHPWCRHVLVPFVAEAKREQEVEALRAASNNQSLEITSNAAYREIVKSGGKQTMSPLGFGRQGRKGTGLPQGEYNSLQDALGGVLRVQGYDLDSDEGNIIRAHVADLARIPDRLLAKLKREGLERIDIGPGSVPDFEGFEHLRKVQAPGYGPGVTWADIAGGYDSLTRRLVAGSRGLDVDRVISHEIGHALGGILSYNDDFRLIEAYEKAFKSGALKKFYLDEGKPSVRGRMEFLADAVGYAIIEGRPNEAFGQQFAEFIRNTVLRGVTARAK